MKLFLDDLRSPPSGGWIWVKSAEKAIDVLGSGIVSEISFDHDLGSELTGYHVACFIEQGAYSGRLGRISWAIHSANPVGRENIRQAMESAERFWRQNDRDTGSKS